MSEFMAEGKAKIKLPKKDINALFNELAKNGTDINLVIEDLEKSVSKQKSSQQKKEKTQISPTQECDSYKFRVDDGWLWIEKGFYRNMKESIEHGQFDCLFDYFESLEKSYVGMFRIVQQENRATVVNEQVVHLIHEASMYTVLNNYDHYYIVYNDGTGDEFRCE